MERGKKEHIHTCPQIGAYLALSPFKDIVLVFCSPAGCEKNVLHASCANDINGVEAGKIHLAQIGDPEAVFGMEKKLIEKVSNVAAENTGKMVFLISSCTPELIGEDIQGIFKKEEFSKSVVFVDSAGFKGDLWQGYSRALALAVSELSIKTPAEKSQSANLIGYFLDRVENDHLSNIRILKNMFEGAGANLNTFLIEPSETSAIRKCGSASHNIVFEFGREAADFLAEQNTQENIYADLPIGLGATEEFIRKIASSLGNESKAEDYIASKLPHAVSGIRKLRSIFRLKKAGIFSDSQKLPGLVRFALEMGMVPSIIVPHNKSSSIKGRINAILGGNTENVLFNPSEEEIKSEVGNLDIIIGSQIEEQKYGSKVPVFVFSYPSFGRHCVVEDPYLGFEGALQLANNIYNILNSKDPLFRARMAPHNLGLGKKFYMKNE